MKKTFTFFIAAVMMLLLGVSSAFAQPGTFYPNYFINQDFEGVEVWPTGWSSVANATTYMGSNNNGSSFSLGSPAYGYASIASSGGGARGAEMRFPSTATSSSASESVWVMEFDWYASAVEINGTKAMGVTLLGPNSVNLHTAGDIYWSAVIAELYVYDPNGYFHYSNLDPIGINSATGDPLKEVDGVVVPVPTGVAASGNNATIFGRRGANLAEADDFNLSTKTKVKFNLGVWYHIFCEMDFATQTVTKFAFYQKDDIANGDTILNKSFTALWAAGEASAVAPEDRRVTELDRVSSWATRGGSGNGNANHRYDNMQLYVWKESVGIADVTINYEDHTGAPIAIKPAVILPSQQVNSTIWLSVSDKATLNDGENYYFYDAAATSDKNKSNPNYDIDAESITVSDVVENNSLTLVFKKAAMTAGTYIWNGVGYNWNYLDENFNVSGGAPIAYQLGNEAQFSATDALYKEVQVVGEIELGDANVTVSAPGYTFAGTGRLVGNGSMIVNAPATLGMDNRLEGGVIIGTSEGVSITNAAAASKIETAQPSITLDMKAGGSFNKAITGTAEGGTLNINSILNNSISSEITGFSTVNISFAHRGQETSNSWTNSFTSTFAEGTTVNVTDVIEHGERKYPATYAVELTSLANAKVNLGENTRIIYNGTPGNNTTLVYLNIGELNGETGSSIQGNSVGVQPQSAEPNFDAYVNRPLVYSIGALGTDAVFNGDITPQLTREPNRRTGDGFIWERGTVEGVDTVYYLANTFRLEKVGAGTWTVGGKIIFPDPDARATHKFTVKEGTLELLDSMIIASTSATLTVESAGTLKTHGNFIGAYTVSMNGTMEGGAKLAANLNMTSEEAVLKLNINSFNEGDFEKIEAAGDIAIKGGILEFIVGTPSNSEIVVLEAGNYDIEDNMATIKIKVNGIDITANTIESNSYYFDPTQGILGYSGPDGLDKNFANKEIRSIEYFNVLGQKVNEHTTGVVLEKTTYTDDSVNTVKTLKKAK
jgi:hypothetical protein